MRRIRKILYAKCAVEALGSLCREITHRMCEFLKNLCVDRNGGYDSHFNRRIFLSEGTNVLDPALVGQTSVMNLHIKRKDGGLVRMRLSSTHLPLQDCQWTAAGVVMIGAPLDAVVCWLAIAGRGRVNNQ
jgi:hypothetical protein